MPADPNEQAQYSFLPWLRRGIIGQADASSISAKDPVSISLRLNMLEGEAHSPTAERGDLRTRQY